MKIQSISLFIALVTGSGLLYAENAGTGVIASTGCPITLEITEKAPVAASTEASSQPALSAEQQALAEKSEGCLVELDATPAAAELEQPATPALPTTKKPVVAAATGTAITTAEPQTDAAATAAEEKIEDAELDALIKEALSQ